MRAVLVFLALLALGRPLSVLTRTEEGKAAAAQREVASPSSEEKTQLVELEISVSRTTKVFEVLHLGRVIWRKVNPQPKEVQSVRLPFPKEGIELGVRVEFAGDGLSVVRCRLTTALGESYDRSAWGEETIDAILSYP